MAKKNPPSFNELVEKRCEPFEGNVQVDFIMRHKVLKYSVKQAAEGVGISNSYGHKINKLWAEDPKFRSRIMRKLDKYPDDYKDACKVMLPTVLKTEAKGLQAMQDNPELAVKHPQLLKQIKQGAGIKFDEELHPVTQNINIEAIQTMIFNSLQEDYVKGGTEVVDAEVTAIEDKSGERMQTE
jgi:ASC-1-like (ASCH) protein